ncbi:MAG: hypothetical protein ABSH53_19205 [Holophaga sp.]|jgi:hypothetical protein
MRVTPVTAPPTAASQHPASECKSPRPAPEPPETPQPKKGWSASPGKDLIDYDDGAWM